MKVRYAESKQVKQMREKFEKDEKIALRSSKTYKVIRKIHRDKFELISVIQYYLWIRCCLLITFIHHSLRVFTNWKEKRRWKSQIWLNKEAGSRILTPPEESLLEWVIFNWNIDIKNDIIIVSMSDLFMIDIFLFRSWRY